LAHLRDGAWGQDRYAPGRGLGFEARAADEDTNTKNRVVMVFIMVGSIFAQKQSKKAKRISLPIYVGISTEYLHARKQCCGVDQRSIYLLRRALGIGRTLEAVNYLLICLRLTDLWRTAA
jgi:hypothetical protein